MQYIQTGITISRGSIKAFCAMCTIRRQAAGTRKHPQTRINTAHNGLATNYVTVRISRLMRIVDTKNRMPAAAAAIFTGIFLYILNFFVVYVCKRGLPAVVCATPAPTPTHGKRCHLQQVLYP